MNSGSGFRFEAEADPNPTLHFDDDPDSDPTQSFTHVGKSGKKFTLTSQQCQFALRVTIGVIILMFWKGF
jgi:hypothetical protein